MESVLEEAYYHASMVAKGNVGKEKLFVKGGGGVHSLLYAFGWNSLFLHLFRVTGE